MCRRRRSEKDWFGESRRVGGSRSCFIGEEMEREGETEASVRLVGGGHVYGEKEAGGGRVLSVLKEDKDAYGVRNVSERRFPKHRIPLGLMLKDLFTPRCGIAGKMRALYLAIVHRKRLIYRYFS